MKKFRIEILTFIAFALAATTGLAQPQNLSGWRAFAEGGAEVELASDPIPPVPDGQGTDSLRLTVKRTGKRFGIVCADMQKVKLRAGQWYDLSFNARTDTRKTFALTVSLENADGKKVAARTTLPEVGKTDWTHYTVALHIRQPVSKCQLVIALADTGSLWLNNVSVVLRKTNKTN